MSSLTETPTMTVTEKRRKMEILGAMYRAIDGDFGIPKTANPDFRKNVLGKIYVFRENVSDYEACKSVLHSLADLMQSLPEGTGARNRVIEIMIQFDREFPARRK